uniref:Uncharacterized protein n=1 Tax=Anguilla anguilla TaxID=7936 RepID=A0A0E9RBM6_ANGAN
MQPKPCSEKKRTRITRKTLAYQY